jgi:hypothetical protein
MKDAATFECVPSVFGVGRVCVEGHEYSWIIVERARWTLSDLMIHSEASAHAGDDAQPLVSRRIVQRVVCGVTRTRTGCMVSVTFVAPSGPAVNHVPSGTE